MSDIKLKNGKPTTKWEPSSTIALPAIGLEIAASDYDEDGKTAFTWDEAMAIEDKLDNGWRLPTMIEWTDICNEVGLNEAGDGYDAERFAHVLFMPRSGESGWWSSTVCSEANSRGVYLSFCSIPFALCPQDSNYKGSALAVRLVRSIVANIESGSFYPIRAWHLEQEEFYTPDGNRPFIVSDGFFGGEVVYEPKTKKVYRVGLMEEQDVDPKFIKKCEFEIRRKQVRNNINIFNIDAVERALRRGAEHE